MSWFKRKRDDGIPPGFKVVVAEGRLILPFEVHYQGRFVVRARTPEDAFKLARECAANLRAVEAFNRAHADR